MSSDNAYGMPISEVLGTNFQVSPLVDGWTALDGIVLVKCLNGDG